MVSDHTDVPDEERTRFLLAHLQTAVVPHRQAQIPQRFMYPARRRCDYHIISLLTLALLLLAHAQQSLCDDTAFPATTQVQLLLAAWGPVAACAALPSPLQSRVAGQGKAATERELRCGPGSVCSVPSDALSAPDAQQPCAVPGQGALRPFLGWWRGEAGPSAPFPASDAWQQPLQWPNGLLEGFAVGIFVEQQFLIHSYLQCRFSS